jgi:hypothetical protein
MSEHGSGVRRARLNAMDARRCERGAVPPTQGAAR